MCITTSRPTDTITTSGGGGSLVVVCPFTGSIHSSLRVCADIAGKNAIGVSSTTFFPSTVSPNDSLVMAFGSSTKKDDSYAMLVTLRQSSLSPTLHWKCRLPESQLSAGIIVSKCGNYIIGGGTSGNIYVWKALGGHLLSSFKAHYRAVTCLAWSSCDRILVTGGADGLVHVFSLETMVMVSTGVNGSSIQPIRSFSRHQLPISALRALPSGRMISGSQDGQIILMELFSDQCLANIQLPHPITCVDGTVHRIFAGTIQGTIYCIDLDQYALYQTQQHGAVTIQRSLNRSIYQQSETVFGTSKTGKEDDTARKYQVELRGHDRAITSLAVISGYEEETLVSGDEQGLVRVWDMASRGCIKTIPLWSPVTARPTSGATANSSSNQALHPITSITVMEERQEEATTNITGNLNRKNGNTGRANSSKNVQSVVNQLKPLQTYTDNSGLDTEFIVKIDGPNRCLWVDEIEVNMRAAVAKRRKCRNKMTADFTPESNRNENEKDEEIRRLREQLASVKGELHQFTSSKYES